ncbi:hypothetical protein C5F52_15050 [Limnohabitans sp. TS-CS-82]|jgi:predicted DsbA family dithiol-disulfide isomerase|uniref:DsbA family oxidoreductase n=1 Tax=Limnohabitans sp. TS-CS-82 TaxID=2094193 RepID=UPI000CF29A9F|nr:DsbA family oxidoreductase [Limnohabitans sp. TS-CS-82]PQA82331.1 hypothetical protein C5F52_15050 [Limnohabitans sp. TS-CS-82]
MNTTGQFVQVDAYFDLICPWCWIGKHYFETACARLSELEPELSVKVRWHSVQLIPHLPPQGLPYQTFYEHRLGSSDAVRVRQAQVQVSATRAGLTIEFARIKVLSNTWFAHRLLASAEQQLSLQALQALQEALFVAYFVEGRDLGDASVLKRLAETHGVDQSTIEWFDEPTVWGEHSGVSWVPYFVFNKAEVLSGAQAPEIILSTMLRSAALGQVPLA